MITAEANNVNHKKRTALCKKGFIEQIVVHNFFYIKMLQIKKIKLVHHAKRVFISTNALNDKFFLSKVLFWEF